MATAQDRIDRALRLIGQIPAGASPTAAETADGLEALNAMLASWRNDRLMAYSLDTLTVPLSAAQTTRTVGPSGNLVATRPVQIENAYIVQSNMTYAVNILNENEWAGIPDKTSTSTWPDRIWPNYTFPDITINLYPVPNASSDLKLVVRTPVTDIASAATTVSLPPGWDDAIDFNLAVRIAPEYEREAPPTVKQMALQTMAALKKINGRPIKAYTELPYLVGNYRSNILTDQP